MIFHCVFYAYKIQNEIVLDTEFKTLKHLELSFDELKTVKEFKENEFEKLTEAVHSGSNEIDRILNDMFQIIQHNQRTESGEKAMEVN